MLWLKNLLKNEFSQRAKEALPSNIDMDTIEIWFEDETRIGQQGSLTRLWARRGTRPRVVRQQQFMYQYIYGACCPDHNKAAALVLPYANTQAMQEFLEEISRNVHQDKHALVIMDRAPWHMTGKLQIPSNITVLWLPPYAPELNPQESVWRVLKDRHLHNRVFTSMDDIAKAACHVWNNFIKTYGLIRSLCSRKWAKL